MFYFVAFLALFSIESVYTAPLSRMVPDASQFNLKAIDDGASQKRYFSTDDAVNFLQSYGYLPNAKDGGPLDVATKTWEIEKALRNFQQFNGLPETGKLDFYTKYQMQLPRCGVKDIEDGLNKDYLAKSTGLKILRRRRRYAMQGSRVRNTIVTFGLKRIPAKFSRNYVISTISTAFKVWEQHVPLRFHYKDNGRPDIEVMFARGAHGDDQPFDGPGKTLGHAFYPNQGSNIHFDEDEPWGRGRRNLLWVAAHEIGHSLGLKHSRHPDALMSNSYHGYGQSEYTINLHDDDIDGIKEIYGSAIRFPAWQRHLQTTTRGVRLVTPATTPATGETTENEALKKLCTNSALDAIGLFTNGSLYAFKDDLYYQLDIETRTVKDGYPRKIRDDWNIPDNIDAFFTDSFDFTWAFKNDRVYKLDEYSESYDNCGKPATQCFEMSRFNTHRQSYNYPKPTIDAVLSKRADGEDDQPVYFFQGPKYWYSINEDGSPSEGFLRNVREIAPEIRRVDAAVYLKDEDGAYIFSGQYYYKVKPVRKYQLKVEPGYPRRIGPDWFGCQY